MKPYLILCSPGSGGLFLTSVFAQLLNYIVFCRFSNTGNAHDMGNGVWKGHESICLIGNHWNLNYVPGKPLYYSHMLSDNMLALENFKIVYICTDAEDYRKVTELYVKKAWPDLWNEEEYNKWAGPDYPPYSPFNIQESIIIQNDLINDFEKTTIKKWYDQNPCSKTYETINFKTIMGIDDLNLISEVEKIIGCSANKDTQDYVKDYQSLNQRLYFDNETNLRSRSNMHAR